MPYIVTTQEQTHRAIPSGEAMYSTVSRQAFATLWSAADFYGPAREYEEEMAERASRAIVYDALRTMESSGGSIGPLPDGTMIDVVRCTFADLARAAGFDSNAYAGSTVQACLAILNAYNGRSHLTYQKLARRFGHLLGAHGYGYSEAMAVVEADVCPENSWANCDAHWPFD